MAAPKSTKKPSMKLTDELADKARTRPLPQDPLSALGLRSLGLRLGIPILVGWVIAFIIPGWIPKAVVGVLTVAVLVLAGWVVRFSQRSRKVAQIVQKADTKEARKEAIAELEQNFKKGDSAAIFAKAQLQMQEDPRAALRTLEEIKLDKVMAPVADEARAQRALIHLMFGEIDDARPLADAIDMTQHKDPKQRVMLAAIVGEAWARSGQAKKAVELLVTFDPEDGAYEELRPQLYRARAFAFAWANDTKQMKAALRRLMQLNAQYLSGFITKKSNPMGVNPRGVHPLLEKEAKDMVLRSGAVSRKMEFRRG